LVGNSARVRGERRADPTHFRAVAPTRDETIARLDQTQLASRSRHAGSTPITRRCPCKLIVFAIRGNFDPYRRVSSRRPWSSAQVKPGASMSVQRSLLRLIDQHTTDVRELRVRAT